MTGRATQRDRDLDDWFAEPDQVLQQAHRPSTRADADLESFEYASPQPPPDDDDWLTADAARREQTRPSVGRISLDSARPGVALAALIVLVAVGLIVSGVFNGNSTPAPPAVTGQVTTPTTTPAGTTKTKPPARPHIVQPTTTLKPGATGPRSSGCRMPWPRSATGGKVDGRYGPATQRAVIRFQQAEGLKADGIFGSKTKLALAHAG